MKLAYKQVGCPKAKRRDSNHFWPSYSTVNRTHWIGMCNISACFGDYIVPRMGKFFLQDLNVGFSSTVGCFQSKIWLNCVITRKGLLL